MDAPSVWDMPTAPRRPPAGRHRPKVSQAQLARIRKAVYERDGYVCRRCGWKPTMPAGPYSGDYALCGPAPAPAEPRPPSRRLARMRVLELDHIVPYSRGGNFVVKNLQSLCSTCNGRKGARA